MIGRLLDSTHHVVRIRKMQQFLVCAADIASRLERVREPEELAALPFILNASLREPSAWRFVHASRGRRTVRMTWRISVDATPAAHAAVLAGAGLSVLPDYLVASDLLSGRLVRVLPDWRLPTGGVHAVLPAARFRPAKVSRFLELMRSASPRIVESDL
jgi:DNA-binding transcriptional LysR family regulator